MRRYVIPCCITIVIAVALLLASSPSVEQEQSALVVRQDAQSQTIGHTASQVPEWSAGQQSGLVPVQHPDAPSCAHCGQDSTGSPRHLAAHGLTPADEHALRAFDEALQQYRRAVDASAAAAVEEARLLAAARTRRPIMRRLLREDARQAFARALPAATIAALPPAVQEQVERQVTTIGDLHVLCAFHPDEGSQQLYAVMSDLGAFTASVMPARRPSDLQRQVPLYLLVLDQFAAVHEDAGRPLAATEVAERGLDPARQHALVGDRTISYTSLAAMELDLQDQAQPDEVVIEVKPGGLGQRLLFVRVDYDDDTGDPTSATKLYDLARNELDPYYAANSYGAVDLSGEVQVTDTLRMPRSKSYYKSNISQLLLDARAAAQDASSDWDYRNFDNDPGNNVDGTSAIGSYGVILPNTYSWAGLASIGGDIFWIDSHYNLQVIGHELGHNFGLRHSNGWKKKNGSAHDPTAGTSSYAHAFCLMGNRVNKVKGHFGAYHKLRLGWIPMADVLDVTESVQTTLFAHDDAAYDAGRRGLFVARDSGTGATDFYYSIEYRTRYGDPSMQHGIEIDWIRNNGEQQLHLLDMSTDTSTNKDAGLRLGTTLSDYGGSAHEDLHITALHPVDGSIPGVEVIVNLNTAANNSPPMGSISQTYGPAGSDLTLTATPEDPDGDSVFAYFWTFEDGSVSLDGSASQQRRWSAEGTYRVSCRISDCKGGVTTVEQDILVGGAGDQPLVNGVQVEDITALGTVPHPFIVTYVVGTAAIDVASLGDDDIRVVGPSGFDAQASLVGYSETGDGSSVVATYQVAAPSGQWDGGANGEYRLIVNTDAIAATSGKTVDAGEIESFVVDIRTLIELRRPTSAAVVIPEAVGLLLDLVVHDNGLPASVNWSQVEGPGLVDWDTTEQVQSGVRFPAAGDYLLRLTVDDGITPPVSQDIAVQVGGETGAGYLATDIGQPATTGSVSQEAGIFTVRGSGSDIWGSSDACHFAYQTLTGDGEIVAQVAITDNPAGDSWAKAGLMMRASLAADSASVCALVSADNGNRFQYRLTSGASTASSGSGSLAWLRLVRAGDVFTGYAADDGGDWVELGSQTVSMPEAISFGFAVTSHADGDLTSATFSATSFGTSNRGPFVDAGVNGSGAIGADITLDGVVDDDGRPDGQVSLAWSQRSGPGTAVFVDEAVAGTSVNCANAGDYLLRLVADDGAVATFDETSLAIGQSDGRSISLAVREGGGAYPKLFISLGGSEQEQVDSAGVHFGGLDGTTDQVIEYRPVPTADG